MNPETSKAINSAELPDGCEQTAINFEFSGPAHVPEWIMLLPAGPEIVGRDKRSWRLDSPQALIEAFHQGSVDLPVDLEHSTELKGREGEPAPAVGWIKALEVRDGAIWGRVDWTNEGKIRVGEREYRYISPVFVFEKETSQIVRLTSIGLTNQPNLHLQALNHQQKTEESMNWKELLALLGLPETATPEMAMNAVTKLQGELQTAINRADTPSLDKFVPRDDYNQAVNRAETAEQKLAGQAKAEQEKAINQAVDEAVKAGKITPAGKDYYLASCKQEGGLDQFRKFIESAPVIAGGTDLQNRDLGAGGKSLNAEEQQVAALFGNSAEDLKKYGKD